MGLSDAQHPHMDLAGQLRGFCHIIDLSSVGLHTILLPILQPCGSISVMRPSSLRLSATYLQQPYSIRSTASVVSEACRFCIAFRMPKQLTVRFSRDHIAIAKSRRAG